MSAPKGYVVAFDGPDGVGKTIQVKLAAEYLEKLGKAVHTTRASGGTPIGEALRATSLSSAERPAEVDVYISLAMQTALGFDLQQRTAQGEICLVDRSPLAVIAYNVMGSELPNRELGFEACQRLLKLWAIDLLIVFTTSQEVVDQRRQLRSATDAVQANNYFENKDAAYHQRVRQGYDRAIQYVKDHPELGIKLVEIDATPSIENVHETVVQALAALKEL